MTGKWGFIDKQGKLVINPQFDRAENFVDGLAPVRIGDEKTGKWGFIDKQGKLVINPQFDEIVADWDVEFSFKEKSIPVRIGDEKTGKWGFISR
jgi:hypothetical protein